MAAAELGDIGGIGLDYETHAFTNYHGSPCDLYDMRSGGFLRRGKMILDMEYSYTVLFEPAEEGGYIAFCPALPGLVTEGDTYEQTRERVKEAIEGYVESLRKDGLPAPLDKKLALNPVKEEIRIAVSEPA